MLKKVFSLWIEGYLPPIAICSIKSFLEQGVEYTLYCYEPPKNVPKGVKICDASDVLPKTSIYKHFTGSWAPFADWWRYEKLYRDGGTWVDLDCYMLKQSEDIQPYYYQINKGSLQTAIGFLSFEPGSQTMDFMRQIAADPSMPVNTNNLQTQKLKEELKNRYPDLTLRRINAPWALLGPDAFQQVIINTSENIQNKEPKHIYPIKWEEWRRLYNDTLTFESEELKDAWMIHLWNDQLRFEPSVWGRMMKESLMNQILLKHAPEYAIVDEEPSVHGTAPDVCDIVVGICSAQMYADRRQAIRDTWMKDMKDTNEYKVKFFYGGPHSNAKRRDEVLLNVDDSYNYLPQKCLEFFRYALDNYCFKWLFKCDDDTYVRLDRLKEIVKEFEDKDIIASSEDFMAGGGGYFLSHKLVELIVKRGCNVQAAGREDDIYGQLAKMYGFEIQHTPYLKQYKKFEPEPDNKIVTCHWCAIEDMKRIQQKFDNSTESYVCSDSRPNEV